MVLIGIVGVVPVAVRFADFLDLLKNLNFVGIGAAVIGVAAHNAVLDGVHAVAVVDGAVERSVKHTVLEIVAGAAVKRNAGKAGVHLAVGELVAGVVESVHAVEGQVFDTLTDQIGRVFALYLDQTVVVCADPDAVDQQILFAVGVFVESLVVVGALTGGHQPQAVDLAVSGAGGIGVVLAPDQTVQAGVDHAFVQIIVPAVQVMLDHRAVQQLGGVYLAVAHIVPGAAVQFQLVGVAGVDAAVGQVIEPAVDMLYQLVGAAGIVVAVDKVIPVTAVQGQTVVGNVHAASFDIVAIRGGGGAGQRHAHIVVIQLAVLKITPRALILGQTGVVGGHNALALGILAGFLGGGAFFGGGFGGHFRLRGGLGGGGFLGQSGHAHGAEHGHCSRGAAQQAGQVFQFHRVPSFLYRGVIRG